MSKLVRYSTIRKKMSMRFFKKKYVESNYSILYDDGKANDTITKALLDDIKNLIIDKKSPINVSLGYIQADNIYFQSEQNLGGITMSFKTILESNNSYYFYWDKEYSSKINKIHIVFDNAVKTFDVNNLGKLRIEKKDNKISLTIKDDRSIIEYIIDELGNMETIKKEYYLTKKDIKDNMINLNNYIDYEKINVVIDNDLKVKELILNKSCMKQPYKFDDAIRYIHYNKLKIVDDDDMKLFPNIINIDSNSSDIFVGKNANKFYILIREKNESLIYIDESDKIKIIDKDKLLKNKEVEDVKFYLEDVFLTGRHFPITVIKYKNKKYKIYFYDEFIEVNRLFTEFNLYYIYKYYSYDRIELNNILINNDWFTMFARKYIDRFKLKRIYADYQVFLTHLKKLKELGFSNKGILYIYENHFNNIINLDIKKDNDDLKYQNDFNINDMTKEEIDAFNELGKSYAKRKRLKK